MSALAIYDDIQEKNLSIVNIAEEDSASVKIANVTFLLFLESNGVNCKYCYVRFESNAIQSNYITEKCKFKERPSKRKRFHGY